MLAHSFFRHHKPEPGTCLANSKPRGLFWAVPVPVWTFCPNPPHHQLDLQYSFMFSGVLQHWHAFYEALPAGMKGVVCNLYWGMVSLWSVPPFSAASVHLQKGEAGVPQFAGSISTLPAGLCLQVPVTEMHMLHLVQQATTMYLLSLHWKKKDKIVSGRALEAESDG